MHDLALSVVLPLHVPISHCSSDVAAVQACPQLQGYTEVTPDAKLDIRQRLSQEATAQIKDGLGSQEGAFIECHRQ